MHNVFDTDEIAVTQYTKYINMDMKSYLLKCDILLDKELKTNGDMIYYVPCPNEKNHSSTGEKHTMIFHKQEENEPNFHCHHEGCSHITFDTFITFNQNRATKENKVNPDIYIKGEVKQPSFDTEAEPDYTKIQQDNLEKVITFHGYDAELTLHVFSSNESLQLIKLKPADITTMNILNIYGDEEVLAKAFPDANKHGEVSGEVDFRKAAKWFLIHSKLSGVFVEGTLKRLGIHKQEGDGHVLNTGDLIYHSPSQKRYDFFSARKKFKEFYMPSSTDRIKLSKKELPSSGFSDLMSLLRQLPFKTERDRVVFGGVMACGLIPGGIETRPSMWVTGKAGSGKTSILETVLSPIWAASGALITEGATTAAGIEQSMKGKNVSVVLDEAESDTKQGQTRLQTILEAAKGSTTTGRGTTIKGTSGGTSRSASHKSCYCFSSVGSMITDDTIKRRVFPVEIEQQAHHKKTWKKLHLQLKRLLTEEFNGEMFLYFMNHLETFKYNYNIVESYLIETSIPSTIMAMWVSILTGYLMMMTQEMLTEEFIKEHLGELIAEISKEYDVVTDDEEKNETYLLNIITSMQVSDENNKRIHISDLIRISLGINTDIGISITEAKAQNMLGKCGLKTNKTKIVLYVHKKHPVLIKLFNGENISGYASRLKLYPGAENSKNAISIGGQRPRPVVIPLPPALLEDSDATEVISHEGEIPDVFDIEIKVK